jgi:hypothetical protein
VTSALSPFLSLSLSERPPDTLSTAPNRPGRRWRYQPTHSRRAHLVRASHALQTHEHKRAAGHPRGRMPPAAVGTNAGRRWLGRISFRCRARLAGAGLHHRGNVVRMAETAPARVPSGQANAHVVVQLPRPGGHRAARYGSPQVDGRLSRSGAGVDSLPLG